jgi:hypothetical protein
MPKHVKKKTTLNRSGKLAMQRELNAIYGNADNPEELRAELGDAVFIDDNKVELSDDAAWSMLQEDNKARAQIAERNREKAEHERKAAVQLAKQLEERNKAESARHAAEKAKYETEKAQSALNSVNQYNREADQLRDTRLRLQNEIEAERMRRLFGYPSDATQVARYIEKERLKKEVKQELDEESKIRKAERALAKRRAQPKPHARSRSKSRARPKPRKSKK